MSNEQTPLTEKEIFKKFDINPSYQFWRHLVVKAVNHYAKQQTAQLRQELEQTKARDRAWSMKARQLSRSLEQANLLLEHVKVLNGGMVDAFRGHDYRQMYEIWQTLLSSLEK